MKISKNPELIRCINKLQEINDLNFSLSDMFLSIVGNRNILSKKEIEILAAKYKKSVKDICFDKILDYWDIDEEIEDNYEILIKYIYPNINECSLKEFKDNPYYKNIKVSDRKIGCYSLVNDKYRAYELFASDDISVDKDYVEQTHIGFFKEDISFIALNQDDVTWMSVNPNEIKTMEKSVKDAHGDVLVYGLGLGYYAYMVSLKPEVKSITVIEKDKNIIKIFNDNLLPQFEQKDKIHIVEADAFEYSKGPLKFDYAFVDLWHNAEDGLNLYIRFKDIEEANPNTTFSYWLEASFYALFRRAFITLLYEQANEFIESNYQKAETPFDEVVNRYYQKTKNLQLNTKEEISGLLKDSNLLKLYR